MHIGSILPILTAIVFLVIVVVKSSLALSLGLVGLFLLLDSELQLKNQKNSFIYFWLRYRTWVWCRIFINNRIVINFNLSNDLFCSVQ